MSEARRLALARLRRERPEEYAELVRLVAESEKRELKRLYETSFLAFVKRAWQEIDSNTLRLNWFHECLIEHMEAVCRGEIRHLIINAPPRCGKSALISVLYPAWVWCRREIGPQSGPQTTFMCITHSANLSEEMAVKSRRLIWGHWFQSLWSDRVGPMLEDQGSRAHYGNRHGGARLSVSLSTGLIGAVLEHAQEVTAGISLHRADAVVIGMAVGATDPKAFPSIRIRKRHGWKVAAAGSSACTQRKRPARLRSSLVAATDRRRACRLCRRTSISARRSGWWRRR